MFELHPGTADQKLTPKTLLQFRFYLDMVKDDWTATQVLQTRNSSKSFYIQI